MTLDSRVTALAAALGADYQALQLEIDALIDDSVIAADSTWSSEKINSLSGGTSDSTWNPADLSAEVAIDTLGMFYWPPEEEDGSTGAYVRNWNGVAQASWGNVGNDFLLVLTAAAITASLFPGATLELGRGVYVKASADSRKIANVTLKGQGVGKTTIRQSGLSTIEPLVDIGSNALIADATIDGANLNTGSLVRGMSEEDMALHDVEVIGWRNGVEFFSDPVDGVAKNITLKRVNIHSPGTNGQVYPFRCNAPWGSEQVENIYLEDVEVIGSGGHYSGVATAGTADQISFQNCKRVRLNRIISRDGGELGLNFSRGTVDVRGDDILVSGCDADGVNIGSGQLIIEVADITGFVEDSDSAAIDIAGVTGKIETIDGNVIYIASASLSAVTRHVEIGDAVVGRLGGSSTVTAWRTSASDVKLTNLVSYGNGRDEAATGNLYAGLKMNLADSVVLDDIDVSETADTPVQEYGIYAINAIYKYSGLVAEDNLTAPILNTGRTITYIPDESVIPAKAVALAKGSNANLDASGEFEHNGSPWRRVAPFSGTEDTITDITGQISDGTLLTLSNAAATTTTTIEDNSRLHVPSGFSLTGLYEYATLIYNDSGSGHWALHSTGVATPGSATALNETSSTELSVENTTTETDLASVAIPSGSFPCNFYMAGYITNQTGTWVTAVIRVKLGSTVVYQDTTIAIISSVSNRPFEFDLKLHATGTDQQKINGRIVIGANAAATTGSGDLGTDEVNANTIIRGSASEDDSAPITLSVTIQFGVADATITAVRDYYRISA